MRFSLLFLTVLLCFSGSRRGDSQLLQRYRALLPFHENILLPTLEEDCEDEVCQPILVEKDNTATMEKLLEDTRKNYSVTDARFLESSLGRHYAGLANFLSVHKGFAECMEETSSWNRERLESKLDRIRATVPCAPASAIPTVLDKKTSQSLQAIASTGEEDALQALGKSISEDALNTSLQAVVLLAVQNEENPQSGRFIKKFLVDICNQGGDFTCRPNERKLLSELIHQKSSGKQSLPVLPTEETVEKINDGISRINSLLKEYAKDKRELTSKWNRENEELVKKGEWKEVLYRRGHSYRQKQLEQLKEETFSTYREEVANFHQKGFGHLFMTDALQNAMGTKSLEKMSPRLWGILGFKKEVLDNIEDFPLLAPIDADALAKARNESSQRVRKQVRTLFKERRKKDYSKTDLIRLLKNYPASVGNVLAKAPKYASSLCQIARAAASKERTRAVAEQATYVGAGLGISIAAIATMGGALPAVAIIPATIAGGAFTVGDYLYQENRANRGRNLREELLGSYLAKTGDKQTINEIRQSWEETLEADRSAKIALGFGIFDLAGIPIAARAGAFARLARNLDGIDIKIQRHRRLINTITANGRFIKAIRKFKKNYPAELLAQWLDEISLLPKKKQHQILKTLAEDGSSPATFSLQELKGLLTREEIARMEQLVFKAWQFDRRKRLAEKALSKKLNLTQAKGVDKAHRVGDGEIGRDGSTAHKGNYTSPQLLRKSRILKESGFAPPEIRRLMTLGIVGRSSNPGEEELISLLISKEQFPKLYEESMLRNPWQTLQSQRRLMKELGNMEEFQNWIKCARKSF